MGTTEPVCGTMGAGHNPMCARWRSTVAIAAAVTASTIWFKEGGGVGGRGIYRTRDRAARGQALCCTGAKFSWRERSCVTIKFRSMEYNRGYLPSVSFSPSGVRAGVAVRAREGGPFRVPSAAGGFFTAALTGGCGGVAS